MVLPLYSMDNTILRVLINKIRTVMEHLFMLKMKNQGNILFLTIEKIASLTLRKVNQEYSQECGAEMIDILKLIKVGVILKVEKIKGQALLIT